MTPTPDNLREKFEKFISGTPRDLSRDVVYPDSYTNSHVQTAWLVWQAATQEAARVQQEREQRLANAMGKVLDKRDADETAIKKLSEVLDAVLASSKDSDEIIESAVTEARRVLASLKGGQ